MNRVCSSGYSSLLCALSRDERGVTLVEFAIALAVFLLIMFGLIDFGRLGFSYVMAEKAMQRAARIATVRPPACAGVPTENVRPPSAPGVTPARFGTYCRDGAGVCANPGTFTCSGAASNPTANEVWQAISALLPNDATIANIRFSYSFDQNLGFLGGPYVPVVTAELQNLTFSFVSPLGALAGLAGAAGAGGIDDDITFPSLSVSLPGEDLAQGTNG
jgi:hypothetical protein